LIIKRCRHKIQELPALVGSLVFIHKWQMAGPLGCIVQQLACLILFLDLLVDCPNGWSIVKHMQSQ
jgi:hypothetical protein